MHEILFRGKNIDNGYWMYGTPISLRNGETYMNFEFMGMIDRTLVIPETICQYTGLTDKNGKKVFEYDIVKAYDPLDEISFIGVVKYFDGSFYICDTDFCSYYRWMDYEVEVIGNIYDNPELLGGVNNG